MLKIKYKPKQVTNIPVNETGESWYCHVDYKVYDRKHDLKIVQYTNKACYGGICSDVISHVLKYPDAVSDIVVRYPCKRALLAVRLPLLEFVARRFSHFFAEVVLDIDEKGEAFVEARSKPTTPAEVFYAFGAFLRLTWEQWSDKHDTTDPIRYIVQSASTQYEIHVPFNFFFDAEQVPNFENYFQSGATEEEKIELTKILLKMIRYRKVFNTPLCNVTKATNHTPYIQLKFYNAMRNNPYFAKRFPNLHTLYGDPPKAAK